VDVIQVMFLVAVDLEVDLVVDQVHKVLLEHKVHKVLLDLVVVVRVPKEHKVL